MNLLSQIESILFVASKPLGVKQLIKATQAKESALEEVLEILKTKYNTELSGIHILSDGGNYQMSTNPDNIVVVDMFIKDDISGELTKAQLETLTVVAYRGPITRPELEQIRGVNCAVILRNLMMRGFVNEDEAKDKILPVYALTVEALRHLGVNTVTELPDYDTLRVHEFIENALQTN